MYISICLFAIAFGCFAAADDCENGSDAYQYHLGTKTPYRIVANTTVVKMDFEGCKPLKLWMLVRHGTRNPSSAFIQKMKEQLPKIRDLILHYNREPTEALRNSDLYALHKWGTKLNEAKNKKLAHEGEDEMLELAERMHIRFSTLLPSKYSNTSFFFKYTASQRTKASAKYFAAGLFGRNVVQDVWFPKALKKDPILRFYKLCNKWARDVKKNPESLGERNQFESSHFMNQAIKSVNKALNIDPDVDLSLEDIHLMYMTCAFETAWNKRKKSPWCSTLTPQALQAMEFAEDLKYYYRDGYGYEVTYIQACPAFNNMLKHLDSDAVHPKAVVYFTHSGTLLKMLAHLGLYNDTKPLTHKDFGLPKIKWRVSKIDSFGTNLAFVSYKCGMWKKMLVMHQERVVQLPGCKEPLCDIDDVREHFKKSVNSCKFNEICDNPT